MDLFVLKKLIGALLSPVTGGLLVLLALSVAILRGPRPARRRRVSPAALLPVFVGVAWVLGTTPVADALLRPFERSAGPAFDLRAQPDVVQVRWVVVLGSGHTTDSRASTLAQLGSEGIYRLVEGVRLSRALPGSRLHVSGWGDRDPRSNAEAMSDAAVALGLDPSTIVMATTPRDTREEAEAFAKTLFESGGTLDEPFMLVTSAAHMPRALRLFQAEGLRPIAAPAQWYALDGPRQSWYQTLLPQPRNYVKVERAVYEALGLVWVRLTSRLPSSQSSSSQSPSSQSSSSQSTHESS